MRKQYHIRSRDGHTLVWDVDHLVEMARALPVFETPVSEIRELDETYWHGEGEHATPRSVADHARLILDADTRYPVILSPDGRVMDGMHRVARAYLDGQTHIRAVRFEEEPAPDYVDVSLDALPYEEEGDATGGSDKQVTDAKLVEVRVIEPHDRDELLRMRQLLWPDSTASETDSVIAAVGGGAMVYVASRGKSGLCGFAELGWRRFAEGCATSPVAYLEGIWVDEDMRQTGVGRALISRAIEWARQSGSAEIGSDTEPHNRVSRAFHSAVGFEEVGQIVCFNLRLPSRQRPRR